MSIYPDATYRPCNQFTNGPMRSYTGVVLHVNDSDGPSLYGWIAGQPGNGNEGMSCHWQVAKDGRVEQYLDTAFSSWCQMNGNDDYLSIETEGFPGEPLTDAQVQAIAALMKWVNVTHLVPLQLAEHPGDRGLGWHGMGGPAWGNHPFCPGDFRKSQRELILHIAAGQETPAPPVPTPVPPAQEDFMAKLFIDGTNHHWADYGGDSALVPLNKADTIAAFCRLHNITFPDDRVRVERVEIDRENHTRAVTRVLSNDENSADTARKAQA